MSQVDLEDFVDSKKVGFRELGEVKLVNAILNRAYLDNDVEFLTKPNKDLKILLDIIRVDMSTFISFAKLKLNRVSNE
jgi:hypothetical protein